MLPPEMLKNEIKKDVCNRGFQDFGHEPKKTLIPKKGKI